MDVPGAPWCWGSGWGGTHIPFFRAVGRQAGLGQWVTPSSRFSAGKDGTVLSPQQMLVPCVVQVGDEAETRSTKPLSLLRGPPGCAGEGLADEISNPAGVARGKERGKAWQRGATAATEPLVFWECFVLLLPRSGFSPGMSRLGHTGGWWRGVRPWLRGSRWLSEDTGSFIPSRARFWTGCVLVSLCSHFCRGVTWGLAAFGSVSGW